MKIIILCTGNSCRSQIAHGYLQSLSSKIEVYSAGTKPAEQVNPKAVEVMKEAGYDISNHTADNVDQYLSTEFDYVITVCGNAQDDCPVFTGKVKNKLHIGFEDPAEATGSEEEVMNFFRKVRDEIFVDFKKFFDEKIRQELD
ncbi:MAG: arsenate reductase ArsC [Rhodothermaceae bacterium]